MQWRLQVERDAIGRKIDDAAFDLLQTIADFPNDPRRLARRFPGFHIDTAFDHGFPHADVRSHQCRRESFMRALRDRFNSNEMRLLEPHYNPTFGRSMISRSAKDELIFTT